MLKPKHEPTSISAVQTTTKESFNMNKFMLAIRFMVPHCSIKISKMEQPSVEHISKFLYQVFIILKYMKDTVDINQPVIRFHFHLRKKLDRINNSQNLICLILSGILYVPL